MWNSGKLGIFGSIVVVVVVFVGKRSEDKELKIARIENIIFRRLFLYCLWNFSLKSSFFSLYVGKDKENIYMLSFS